MSELHIALGTLCIFFVCATFALTSLSSKSFYACYFLMVVCGAALWGKIAIIVGVLSIPFSFILTKLAKKYIQYKLKKSQPELFNEFPKEDSHD
ncbi:hypothetical protein [Algicola sagamiensis]|uniref:hypothetical protein n=1 Tax=Algicola sagamiensis TaxID=163869 RepID=UPI00037002E1|nr:hypothetical protein [Algicola sagamiensis]